MTTLCIIYFLRITYNIFSVHIKTDIMRYIVRPDWHDFTSSPLSQQDKLFKLINNDDTPRKYIRKTFTHYMYLLHNDQKQ